jgi:hypothetical protein
METPPSSRSRVTMHPRPVNANTCLPGAIEPGIFARAFLREAYPIADGISRALPPMSAPGYRLHWVSGGVSGSVEVPAGDGSYRIIGRHSCCDVILDRDPEIALRHLLLRAEPAPEGGTLLRVLDLHTSLPVQLEDGSLVRSMLVSGPVGLRLGRYALVALPSGVTTLPERLPSPVVEHCVGAPYRSPAPRSSCQSHVSILPRAPMLDELRQGPASAPFFARLTLAGPRGTAHVDVTEGELDKGILVGRAPKCDPRLSSVLDEGISRVHLLLLRERKQTFAFDLASMNGTYADGQRVRRVRLSDAGSTLNLGYANLCLFWNPRVA